MNYIFTAKNGSTQADKEQLSIPTESYNYPDKQSNKAYRAYNA